MTKYSTCQRIFIAISNSVDIVFLPNDKPHVKFYSSWMKNREVQNCWCLQIKMISKIKKKKLEILSILQGLIGSGVLKNLIGVIFVRGPIPPEKPLNFLWRAKKMKNFIFQWKSKRWISHLTFFLCSVIQPIFFFWWCHPSKLLKSIKLLQQH